MAAALCWRRPSEAVGATSPCTPRRSNAAARAAMPAPLPRCEQALQKRLIAKTEELVERDLQIQVRRGEEAAGGGRGGRGGSARAECI